MSPGDWIIMVKDTDTQYSRSYCRYAGIWKGRICKFERIKNSSTVVIAADKEIEVGSLFLKQYFKPCHRLVNLDKLGI